MYVASLDNRQNNGESEEKTSSTACQFIMVTLGCKKRWSTGARQWMVIQLSQSRTTAVNKGDILRAKERGYGVFPAVFGSIFKTIVRS